jgi:prophage regulatory protein
MNDERIIMMTEERFLKIDEVHRMTTISASEIKRRAREGRFPKSVKLGAQRSVWLLSEVQRWIKDTVMIDRGNSAHVGP